MKNTKRFVLFFLFYFILYLSACSRTEPLKTLSAEEITSLGNNCDEIYKSHTDAWISKEPENLRQVYTDDIVHFDGYPLFVGIDAVVKMAEDMNIGLPRWQLKADETYISKDMCLGTWINWFIFRCTQDDPCFEYDLLETRDGKISFWRLFYDQDFYDGWGYPQYIKNDLLAQYASSWSSGKTNEILKLYSTNAKLEDTLFGISTSGKRAIGDYANSILGKSPGANWKLIQSFAESEWDGISSHGGVFAITAKDAGGNPCEIHAVVILTPDEEGKIQSQKVFYNADSLLACGWAK